MVLAAQDYDQKADAYTLHTHRCRHEYNVAVDMRIWFYYLARNEHEESNEKKILVSSALSENQGGWVDEII